MLRFFMSLRSRASGLVMLSWGLDDEAKRIRACLYSIYAWMIGARERFFKGVFFTFPTGPAGAQVGRARFVAKDASEGCPFRARVPFCFEVRR